MSCDENQHLLTCLLYIAFKKSVGSLAAHEDFELMKYSEFLSMSKNVMEKAGTGSLQKFFQSSESLKGSLT